MKILVKTGQRLDRFLKPVGSAILYLIFFVNLTITTYLEYEALHHNANCLLGSLYN